MDTQLLKERIAHTQTRLQLYDAQGQLLSTLAQRDRQQLADLREIEKQGEAVTAEAAPVDATAPAG